MNGTLLVGDKGKVDFEHPIKMTDVEFDAFKTKLKQMFDFVDVEPSITHHARLGTQVTYPREWSMDEEGLLLHPLNHHSIAERLGRSGMTVIMRRMKVSRPFRKWRHSQGRAFNMKTLKADIITFLKEREKQKQLRRKQKVKAQQLEKKIKEGEKKIAFYDRKAYLEELQVAHSVGLITEEPEEVVQKKKDELRAELTQWRKELKCLQ